MSGRKEAKEMAQRVRDAGYVVGFDGKEHYTVIDPQTGAKIHSFAQTPSTPRFVDNTIADLRRKGVFQVDPRKEGQMATNRQTTGRSAQVRETMIATLVKLGWNPEKRGPHVRELVNLMPEVAKRRNMKGFKTFDSGYNTVLRLLHNQGNASNWTLDLIEATLGELNGTEPATPTKGVDQTTGTPRRDTPHTQRAVDVRGRLKTFMGTMSWAPAQLASEIQGYGIRGDYRVWSNVDKARVGLVQFMTGQTLPDSWVLDLVESYLDAVETRAAPVELPQPKQEPKQDAVTLEYRTAAQEIWGDGTPLHVRALILMMQPDPDQEEVEAVARQILDLEIEALLGS